MKQKEVFIALGWFNHRINEGVAHYARQAGWHLNFSYMHDLFLPDQWNGDGIISMLDAEYDAGYSPINAFVTKHLHRVPVVDLSLNMPDLNCARVLEDNLEIGRLGAKHFVERQFSKIGFFKNHASRSAKIRQQGFLEQAHLSGVEIFDLDFIARYPQSIRDIAFQMEWLGQKLQEVGGPIGVMAINDEEAITAIRSALQYNISVPSQAAILGVDDSPFAGELSPIPLSSVKTDPYDQGVKAAQLLDQILAGKPAPKEPIMLTPKSIVVRRSTDILAADDSRVAEAIEFIRDNFRSPITIDDIADKLMMSRRRLHDLFMQNISQSIHDYIVSRRIEHACKLLKTTDWSIKRIAANSGFSSSVHMCQTFARELKATPSQIRNLDQ